MNKVKDEAICTRHQNYSESSQIVTLFARASGKVRAIAKGSRRPKGRFGGGIDVLCAGSIIFTPPRGESALATLIEYELTESFPLLRRELLALNCGQYAAELVGQFTADLDPHEDLYDILTCTLKQLETHQRCELALLNFELNLLREVGLTPVWDRCCGCGGTNLGRDRIYFSSDSGGVLCRDCEAAVVQKHYITPDALDVLQHPQLAAQKSPAQVIEAHKVIWRHTRDILGKETAIMSFTNRLLDRQRG